MVSIKYNEGWELTKRIQVEVAALDSDLGFFICKGFHHLWLWLSVKVLLFTDTGNESDVETFHDPCRKLYQGVTEDVAIETRNKLEIEEMIRRRVLSIPNLKEFLPNMDYSLHSKHYDRWSIDINNEDEEIVSKFAIQQSKCPLTPKKGYEYFDLTPESNFQPNPYFFNEARWEYLQHYFTT